MRGTVLRVVALAGCASSRAVFALRHLQAAFAAGNGGSGGLAEGAAWSRRASAVADAVGAEGRWDFRRLHERIELSEDARDLVLAFMPVRYYWVALGRSNARFAHVGVWEIAVSFRGDLSGHLHFVGDFTPCRALADRGFWGRDPPMFAAFLPYSDDLFVACAETLDAVFLESWHVPARRSKRLFEEMLFHHDEHFPFRHLSLEHLFSHGSPPREWFVGEIDDSFGLWNTTSWEMVWQQPHREAYATAFAPSGDMLAVVEEDWDDDVEVAEKMTIFAVASGAELCSARLALTRLAMRGPDHTMGFTGEYVTVCDALGGTSATFRLVFTDGVCELEDIGQRRPCCDATASGLVLHGSRSSLSVGAIGGDPRTPLFQTTFEVPFERQRQDCSGARFSPDGRSVFFRDRMKWFIWPFADGTPPWPVPIDRMVFSDDGALLVGHTDAGLKLVHIGSGTERDLTPEPNTTQLSPRDFEGLIAVGGPRRLRPPPRQH